MRLLRQTALIARRELTLLAGTPLFWVLAGVFFIATSFVYLAQVIGFARVDFRDEANMTDTITVAVVEPLFWTVHFFLLVQIPLLTMRTLAEERRTGTLALLMTTPASEWSIVLGKWIANAAMLGVYLALTLVFAVLTDWISDPDWPVIVGCVLALVMAAAAYTAVGIAFSAGTESQVVSAVLTYTTLFSMLIVSALSEALGSPEMQALVRHLAFTDHMRGFFTGNVALHDGVYFAGVTFLGLFFAVRQLESLRWRSA